MIDRLAYWYYHPREWLKKAALMDGTYLLNSPFTFQSMEKHSAYCAMVRLGLKIPRTVLVPYKNPVDNTRWAYTAAKYNQSFDLDTIAADLGYPLYMKPFDGGGWRGVSRINNQDDLHKAYDESGEMLMHLQATVDYDKFARALSIGPETMVMDFRPDEPMHNRYAVSHGFLSPKAGSECAAISRIINAFFGWEFNSAEMLVAGRRGLPHRLRQRLSRRGGHVAALLLPLGDHRPGALVGLLLVTGRKAGRPAHRAVLRHRRRRVAVLRRARSPPTWRWPTSTSTTDRYWQFCEEYLPHLAEQVHDWVTSPRLRPDPARDRGRDLPRARARAVHGPLPRADRDVGEGQRPCLRSPSSVYVTTVIGAVAGDEWAVLRRVLHPYLRFTDEARADHARADQGDRPAPDGRDPRPADRGRAARGPGLPLVLPHDRAVTSPEPRPKARSGRCTTSWTGAKVLAPTLTLLHRELGRAGRPSGRAGSRPPSTSPISPAGAGSRRTRRWPASEQHLPRREQVADLAALRISSSASRVAYASGPASLAALQLRGCCARPSAGPRAGTASSPPG